MGGRGERTAVPADARHQNRRIIDRAFRAVECAPIPRLETNSVINLCANVHLMGLASIIPEYFLEVLGPISDVRAVPLIEPMVEHSVGLVAVDRDPVSPLVLAAFECARITEPPPIPAASESDCPASRPTFTSHDHSGGAKEQRRAEKSSTQGDAEDARNCPLSGSAAVPTAVPSTRLRAERWVRGEGV